MKRNTSNLLSPNQKRKREEEQRQFEDNSDVDRFIQRCHLIPGEPLTLRQIIRNQLMKSVIKSNSTP